MRWTQTKMAAKVKKPSTVGECYCVTMADSKSTVQELLYELWYWKIDWRRSSFDTV